MKKLLLLTCVLVLGLSACQNKEVKSKSPKNKIVWEDDTRYPYKSHSAKPQTQFFKAPKLSGHQKMISGFENPENLSESISLKVERAWKENDTRKVIVVLENKSNKGTRANFYLFSHDERGLLIDVQQEEIFFNPSESIFRSFEFKDSEKAKSWSMSVK